MSDDQRSPIWRRVNLTAWILVAFTLVGAITKIALATADWIYAQTFRTGINQHEIAEVEGDIKVIQEHEKAADKELSELLARIVAQDVAMDKADTELRHQMTLLETRCNFAIEHAPAALGPHR